MPKKTSGRNNAQDAYWRRRIRSKEFGEHLSALFAEEFTALSSEKIEQVVDSRLVRKIIQEWDGKTINHAVIAGLVIRANSLVQEKLQEKNKSLLGLLDKDLIAAIDDLLEEDIVLSRDAERFIAKLMEQEFVRSLFTDIIYTSIVAFYQRINPFFGGITMMVLEDQVKGFIRFFMPMVQRQATAFAMNQRNQPILSKFTRAIARQLLAEPLPLYFAMTSGRQTKKAEALIKQSIGSVKLESLIREMALAVWDDLYERIKNKRVGDLVHLEKRARLLAERSTDLILRSLSRPRILRFVASERALAGGQHR